MQCDDRRERINNTILAVEEALNKDKNDPDTELQINNIQKLKFKISNRNNKQEVVDLLKKED